MLSVNPFDRTESSIHQVYCVKIKRILKDENVLIITKNAFYSKGYCKGIRLSIVARRTVCGKNLSLPTLECPLTHQNGKKYSAIS